MRFQIQQRGQQQTEIRPEFELVGDDIVIGSTTWPNEDGRRRERYQVITLRDGKIADLQGCASRREAERFARRERTRRSASLS